MDDDLVELREKSRCVVWQRACDLHFAACGAQPRDMTLGEKVYAVYDYVYTHVRYSAKSDKTDWRREALRGIQNGKGDCFTSNSLARALLEQTEAEVFSMQRKSFNTNHYWLLVNVGTGWYHFDATNSREHGYKCRMWTDEQCSVMGRFWAYEVSACPPVNPHHVLEICMNCSW